MGLSPLPPLPPVTAPPFSIPPISAPPIVAPPTVIPPVIVGGPADLEETTAKTVNDTCIKRLDELQIEHGSKTYSPPTAPGASGKAAAVQTNIYGVELKKEITIYHYMIHSKVNITPSKEAVFTKKGKEDFVVLDRLEKCCLIFHQAVQKNRDFFKIDQGNSLVYDGQSQLFTTVPLFENDAKKGAVFEVNGSETDNSDLKSLTAISVGVFPSKIGSLVISSDILATRTADSNINANNRLYTQFLELALSQTCIRETARFGSFEHGKVYFLRPMEEGFLRNDCIDVGDGKSLLPGIKKRVQFIEGPFGRGQNNPSLVIDAVKAAFHKEQVVIEKIQEVLQKDPSNGLNEFEREWAYKVMNGLDVYSTYGGRTRHLKLQGIYKDSAAIAKFELKDGRTVTVQQHFAEVYNIKLRHPNANLLICKDRGNSNFFPSELMTISKHQRVKVSQLTGAQSQRTTQECAVLPDVRQRLIVVGKEALQMNMENTLLKDLGIKVYSQPLMANGRELEGKTLEYTTDRSAKCVSGKWRPPFSHFVKPATMPDVWALYCVGTAVSKFTSEDMDMFIKQFVEVCTKKGMRIKNPSEAKLIGVEEVEARLAFAVQCKCKFVFLITEDTVSHVHPKIKYIERNTSMIVQDMKMSKAASVVRMGKRLTLENVVNKTNVKLGGLNYVIVDSLKCMENDQLLIGVGVSAPPQGSKFLMEGKGYLNPMIVGFASNAVSNQEFTGDFVLAKAGQEAIVSIEDVLRRTIELFTDKRKTSPKKVVVYRSGASDGSHGSILAYEIPLARGILNLICPGAALTYLIVTKDHANRFFLKGMKPGQSASDMNIPAGIVIDSGITSPACKQFFLNSHTTLQGTAKTPLYTVLHDDRGLPMEKLEELTYTLCHHHQIVTLNTSLPTPLYVANEYAKRGRTLWSEKTGNVPELVDGEAAERIRLAAITEELAYRNTSELFDKRVNA